jgi:diguanylate cyclase (GGDEF)-like protein/PAS domain S-box-containing protein
VSGYLFFAWTLTLVVATLIGMVHGGWLAAAPPLLVVLAWAGHVVVGRLRVRSARAPRAGSDAEARREGVRALLQNTTPPAAVVAHGLVNATNRAMLDFLRWADRGDLIVGMPFSNLVHPEDHARVASLYQLALNDGQGGPVNVRLLRADDLVLSCEISALRLDTAPGATLLQFDLAVGEKLSRPADRDGLDRLLDGLEQAVFHTGMDGRFTYLSRAWERLTGLAAAECLGQPLTALLHPEDRSGAEAALRRVAGGGEETLLAEVRLLAGDGTQRWVELRASPFASAGGEPNGVVGSVTKVTQRKQLEKSVRSSRRQLNTLLANVPGMVYRGFNDREWTMEFVSDGSIELTGYEPHEFIDKANRAFVDLIHPEDREFVWALVQTQLAQFKPYQLSYRIIDAAGETKWVWEQGQGIFSSSGELLALEGFITDVSARRGAEEQAKRRLWFDARTGLASRAIFDDRFSYVLEHAGFTGCPCAIFLVDLDDFSALNVRYGHDFGDRVLVQLARRFKVVQGPGTTVALSTGDEFTVLLTDFRLGGATTATPAQKDLVSAASRLAERLGQALAEPVRMEGQECRVTASIGVVIGPSGYASTEGMLQAARKAVAAARTAGPGHWRLAED